MPHSASRPFVTAALAAVLSLGLVAGCNEAPVAVSREASDGRAERQRATQSNALLDSIKAQLRSLPESVQLELTPPTVLLDSRSSADNQDVLAALTRRPGTPPQAPANQIVVASRNAGFRRLGVRPGDTVKYFVLPDRDTRDRLRETGEADIVTFDSIDLSVAQVLDDNSLLIAGGLPGEITTPARLEVWRSIDDRMQEINSQLARYAARRAPPLAWQPSPDEKVLGQLTERLNQWLRQGRADDAGQWAEPTLSSTLPAELAGDERVAPLISPAAFSDGQFTPHESRLLQQAAWARDIALWARGDAPDAVGQATALFDWTVVALRLERETPPQEPWQALLHGQATAEGRAWVFALLCRQIGLTGAVVVVPATDGAPPRTLAALAHEESVYLFDPTLGLPLPDGDGARPATLSAVRQDDALLRALDLPDAPYPLTAERMQAAQLGVVAGPFALSRRAALVERRLTGADSLRVAVDAAATADTLRGPGVENEENQVVLWPHPFETLRDAFNTDQAVRRRMVKEFLPFAWRPALWKARVLHFRGRLEEPTPGARGLLSDGIDDHRAARLLYMDPSVRPPDRLLERLDSPDKIEIYRNAKALATYWLGTIALERGEHETAKQWLENPLLATPESAWLADGVRHNLARACAALGETDRAIELFESGDSPQEVGDRIRAARLRAGPEAGPPLSATTPTTATP